jgi:6-phosphogluconolactonase
MSPGVNVCFHDCANAPLQAVRLAKAVADQLRQAVAVRGQALMAVSGGRSPLAFFAALREQRLDWARVTVLLADERCVPPDHSDSNAHMVRAQLLQAHAAPARLLGFFDALPAPWHGTDAELSALTAISEERLSRCAWPLDVLVLGMGEDGHTASLFPQAPGLALARLGPARVAWVRPTAAPYARLTLTLPVLEQAQHAHLVLAGQAKHDVLARAMAQDSDALPVSWVLRRPGAPLQVWRAP